MGPNRQDISKFINEILHPEFVHHHPDDLLEVAWSGQDSGAVNRAELFSVFEPEKIIDFIIEKNERTGTNVYVGPVLRRGNTFPGGRAKDDDTTVSRVLFADLDSDDAMVSAREFFKVHKIKPSFFVRTGTIPEDRAHAYFVVPEGVSAEEFTALQKAIIASFPGSDEAIHNKSRIMRVAGTVSYPSARKVSRGYKEELTSFHKPDPSPTYTISQINHYFKPPATTAQIASLSLDIQQGRTDDELMRLIDGVSAGNWHHPMLRAVATMVGRGYSDDMIYRLVAHKCEAGYGDPDVKVMIDGARSNGWGEKRLGMNAIAPADTQNTPILPHKLILTAEEFLSDYTPPNWVLEGVFQGGYLYTITARTGVGKTAVAMSLANAVSIGAEKWAGRDVRKGRVLYLAGENPDDLRLRYMGISRDNEGKADIHFISGVHSIAGMYRQVKEEADRIGPFDLVIIDTGPAYFSVLPDADMNNNAQALAFARSMRDMANLKGRPAIIALTHPPKGAHDDNLIPYGAGALVNEVDGNLALVGDGQVARMSAFHKFRGKDFPALVFQLSTVEVNCDKTGEQMETIIARPVSDAQATNVQIESNQIDDVVLNSIGGLSKAERPYSVAQIMRRANIRDARGEYDHGAAARSVERLLRDKLLVQWRGQYQLTTRGRSEIKGDDDGDEESFSLGLEN